MKRRVAVVTGGNRGLGLGTVKKLVSLDYTVVLAARDKISGHAAALEISSDPNRIVFLPLDVSDAGSIQSFAKTVLAQFTAVDVLINNAGIFVDQEVSEDPAKLSDSVLKSVQTNTIGPLLLSLAFLPAMRAQNYGRIVNVSSGMGQLSDMNTGNFPYRISKTALNAVTKICSQENLGKNILVNSVCPGWVRTDMGGPQATRTIDEGIAGIIWAATLPDDGPTGSFFRDGKRLDW
jgi:NAD(P)-dependent dehydrogenase (short-subunit alcohol dehydrogenase family)